MSANQQQSAYPFAGLFLDKKTSDFTIICRGRRIPVHKKVLGHYSKKFQGSFKWNFIENQTNEYNLTLDDTEVPKRERYASLKDDDPYLVLAFLKTLYTGQCPTYEDCINTLDGNIGPGNLKSILDLANFYARVSAMADAFLVEGIDDIVAQHIFPGANGNVVGDEANNIPVESRTVRTDDAFVHAISAVFTKAKTWNSHHARKLLPARINDHWHHLTTNAFHEKMYQIPEMGEALSRESDDGKTRVQCPDCHRVLRIPPRDLRGNGPQVTAQVYNVDDVTVTQWRDNYAQETQFHCVVCNKSFPTEIGRRRWRAEWQLSGYDTPQYIDGLTQNYTSW